MVLLFHYLNNAYSNAAAERLNTFEVLLKKLTYWGWAGVDLFFILSGFLIASILISNRASRAFFRTFYIRRFSRIVPIYYLLLVVFFLAAAGLSDTGSKLFARPIEPYWYAAFLQNFQMSIRGNFGPYGLAPTWSLAVEEQFYLVIPLVIYLLNDKKVMIFCLLCIVAAPIYRAFAGNWYQAYTHLFSRIDAPCYGVLLALFRKNQQLAAWLRTYAFPVALIPLFMLTAFIFFDVKSLNHSIISLFFLALTAIAVRLSAGQFLYRALASRFLQLMGRYSYFIYLYHLLVNGLLFLLLSEYLNPTIENWQGYIITALSFAVTGLLAHLSYRYLESRMIAWSHRFSYH